MSRWRRGERETSRVRSGVEAPNDAHDFASVARLRRVGVVAGFFRRRLSALRRTPLAGVTEDAKIVVEESGSGGAELDAAPASTTAARAWTFLARVAAATATSWHMHRILSGSIARLASAPRTSKWYRRFSSPGGSSGGGGGVRRAGRRSGCTVRTWGRRRRRCARRRRRGRRGARPGIERAVRARGGELGDAGREGPRADGLFGGGVVHPAVEPGDGGAAEPRGDGGGDEVARESGRRRGNIGAGDACAERSPAAPRVRERRENERASGLGRRGARVYQARPFAVRPRIRERACASRRPGRWIGRRSASSPRARAQESASALVARGEVRPPPATRFSRENAADESALFATSKTTTEGCPPAIVSSERRKSEEPDEASEAASEEARFVRSKKSLRRAARSFFARAFVMMRTM